MNKDEILQKARHRKKNDPDEREERIIQKSYYFSTLFMALICSFIIFLRMEIQQSYDDVRAIFFIGLGIFSLYKGIKLHQILDIVLGIGFLFLSISSLYFYYCHVMG